MERRRIELRIDELFITEAKAAYIETRDIAVEEVFQVLSNAPRFFVRSHPVSGKEEFAMLGRTNNGRFLAVAIEEMGAGTWRLITAYPLNHRRGQRLYEGG